MKSILLADDLNDKSPIDRIRAKLTRAWAKFFSQKLDTSLLTASVLKTNESVWEMNMLHKTYSRMIANYKARSAEKDRLERVAAGLKSPPLFLVGSPAEELIKLATSNRFQMLVMGTHGHQGLKRVFLGSVAEEVVRHSDIPVCVVGPKVQESQSLPPQGKFLNLVVATDLGQGSRAAEKWAVQFAKKTGATITLAHCVYQGQDPVISMALNTPEGAKAVADLFQELNRTAKIKLSKKQQEFSKAGVECKTFLDRRSVFSFRTILKAADREKANLIVAGTHGRTLLGQAFLGSTARQTILRSPVPVVIVRSR